MSDVFQHAIGIPEWPLAVAAVLCLLASLLAAPLLWRARTRRDPAAPSNEQLRQQNLLLDAAVNNMSQGLCMYNANEEIVVFNRRYLDMYKLSPQVVKPGCTFRELIRHRTEVGLLKADPEPYYRHIIDNVRQRKTTRSLIKTTEGRYIQVFNQPMSGGGWVTTHEDVTERRHAEDRVREQKLQLDTALNNMSQGLNMFDAAGRLVVCNERYLQMYGLSADIVKPGCSVEELVRARIASGTFFAADPEHYIADLLETMHQRNPTSTAMELPDGRIIAVNSQPTPDGGGWVVTHEDITERRRTEMERDRSQAFATTVIENVPTTILLKDARTLRYVLVNKAGERYLGMTRDKVIGKTAADIHSNEEAAAVAEYDRRLIEDGSPQHHDDHPITMPNGERRVVATTRLVIRNDHDKPQYLLAMVDDRTHRKRAEAEVERLVHHDLLTSLPNRAAFTACINATTETATREGASFALLCLDFDRFKEVNDVYGHAAGDEVLRQLARRLQAAIGGAFVARLGSDEFVVIATDGQQPAAAEAMVDRLLAAIREPIAVNGEAINIGLSIGAAIFPADGADSASLIADADAALDRAKAEGRGRFRFFEAGMDQRLRERRALQHELRSAIARGELTLHYQPQARIDGEVFGFEALVRWQHPQRGLIPPGTFIPLAEECGLIAPLGEWIMREACREAASWPKPLQIAVNLSPVEFRHGDLTGLVHSVLLQSGLAPSRLELEITEGVLIDDFSRAVSTLRRLKALGLRIAMDDFGTGYSSLSYLQSFPFDKIKIDKSFICNLGQNNQSLTIVRAVIGLARALELPVLAEGVETKEQLGFLAKESCDEVQGYLIGRPRPIEYYAALTGRRKKARAAG